MTTKSALHAAADILDDMASGIPVERSRLIAGALALDTLRLLGEADRDCLDAAAGLEVLATGGRLDLDATGKKRAGVLAQAVRRHAQAQVEQK